MAGTRYTYPYATVQARRAGDSQGPPDESRMNFEYGTAKNCPHCRFFELRSP